MRYETHLAAHTIGAPSPHAVACGAECSQFCKGNKISISGNFVIGARSPSPLASSNPREGFYF